MSVSGPTDAIKKSIVVRCDVDRAFRTWTEQIHAWWPRGHSRSGDPSTTVCLERRVGGRLYERTPNGTEYDWGRVIAWDPPRHFAYHWFLGSGPEQPTRVDVHFVAQEMGGTRVDVSHRGPEFIGETWARNSARYDAAWEVVLPAYAALCANILEEETSE
ncbi:MAG: SRPBCC domain-containing protein [Chloroflexia bacterium]